VVLPNVTEYARPSVAGSEDGFALAYVTTVNGRRQVRAAFYDNQGSPLTTEQVLSAQPATAGGPKIVWNEDHYAVFWSEGAGSPFRDTVVFQRFTRDGAPIATDEPKSLQSRTERISALDAFWDSENGRYVLVAARNRLNFIELKAGVPAPLDAETVNENYQRVGMMTGDPGNVILIARALSSSPKVMQFDSQWTVRSSSVVEPPSEDFDLARYTTYVVSAFAGSEGLSAQLRPLPARRLFSTAATHVRLAPHQGRGQLAVVWRESVGSALPGMVGVRRYAVDLGSGAWSAIDPRVYLTPTPSAGEGLAVTWVGSQRLLIVWEQDPSVGTGGLLGRIMNVNCE
jgi:hypothetical protein